MEGEEEEEEEEGATELEEEREVLIKPPEINFEVMQQAAKGKRDKDVISEIKYMILLK